MFKTVKFKSLPSTQDKAREYAKRGISNITIVAETQTKSRGRFKRKWISSKGGLWISILLRPKSFAKLQFLTFVAAISVLETIKTAKINAKIKWPNDIHYKKKKLCGILTESVIGNESYAIVGIGLNVNQEKFPKELEDIATSMKIITKKEFEIRKIQEMFLEKFFDYYGKYFDKSEFRKIHDILQKNCDTIGKNVIISVVNKQISGFATGIDSEGRLLVRLKNGKAAKVVEGDIRIRY